MKNLYSAGAVHIKYQSLLRYSNGESIAVRPIGDEWFREQVGDYWYMGVCFEVHINILTERNL